MKQNCTLKSLNSLQRFCFGHWIITQIPLVLFYVYLFLGLFQEGWKLYWRQGKKMVIFFIYFTAIQESIHYFVWLKRRNLIQSFLDYWMDYQRWSCNSRSSSVYLFCGLQKFVIKIITYNSENLPFHNDQYASMEIFSPSQKPRSVQKFSLSWESRRERPHNVLFVSHSWSLLKH